MVKKIKTEDAIQQASGLIEMFQIGFLAGKNRKNFDNKLKAECKAAFEKCFGPMFKEIDKDVENAVAKI